MRATFSRGLAISIGLVATLLILNGGLAYRNTRRLDEDARWVAHTHEVLDALQEVVSTVKDAETGQRGFLITGQAGYLEPYHAAVAAVPEQVEHVAELTADNPDQQARLPALRRHVTAKLAELEQTVQLRRDQGFEAARQVVLTHRGQAEMDALRALVRDMAGSERTLLREREQQTRRSYQFAVATGVLTALLGLALVGLVVAVLRRYLDARRASAAVLFKERELFRTTLASIGDAVITTDIDGKVTFLNAAAQGLTGWRPEEAAGQALVSVFRIVNEQTRQPAEDPASRSLREGTIVGLANHTVLLARDGSERPIDDSAAPIRNAAGTVAGVVLVFRDVTERRRLERLQQNLQRELERQVQERTAALRASEERFRLLVEGTRDYAIYMLDPTGHVASWNPGAERIKGYRADEVLGRHFAQFFPAEDVQRGKPDAALRTAAAEGKYEDEGWRLRKDGSRFWASVVITALYDDAGGLRGFSKITRDLTAKKQADETARRLLQEQAARQAAEQGARRLRASEGRLRLFVEHVPAAVAMFDREMHYLLVSRRWLTDFHLGEQDLTGRSHYDVFPDLPDRWKEVHRRALAGAVETCDEDRFVRHDGREDWLRWEVHPWRDDQGEIGGIIIFSEVITERRQAQEALRQADRLKDEFLAMLAHELRNPLAPISNALHIMRQPRAGAAILAQVRDMAERQVQHMARLLDDLLDVSRISRGKIILRREIVDVAAAVHRTVEALRPLAEERRHELTVCLPPEPVWVFADPTRLEQVLSNLLHNSVKYTDPGGHIRLTVQREAGEVVIRVLDDGIGIAADLLPRVFDIFVQAERRLDRSQGGMGIGLTLVRRLVELHGGTVGAHSRGSSQGSEFVVRLPVQAPEGAAPPDGAEEHPAPAAAVPSRRVLVVDDNEDAAESLAVLLRLEGQEVRVAFNGPEALELAAVFRPEVVFLDIGMPGMDGYEVARRLRALPQLGEVVLVAQTGWGQEEDRRRSREAGFDQHLVKPTDPAALRSLLTALQTP